MARHGENIRKRKDGRWEARVICGRPTNGKTSYKYLYGHSYEEVRRMKNELIMKTAKKSPELTALEAPKETVKMLLEEWLGSVQNHVKESTMAKYYFYVYRHIVPELGELLLTDLTTDEIERFKNRKLTEGRIDQKGGLAPKTVTDLLAVLKLALAYGEERKYFTQSQIKIRNPRQVRPQIHILTQEEQHKVMENVLYQEDCTHLGIVIALYLGLRIGEICALRWGDIDFSYGTLRVCRTIMRITNYNSEDSHKTRIIIERPKTECSNRLIPMPGFLIEYLRPYQQNEQDYIITGKKSFMEPRNYYRKYKRFMSRCGMGDFTFHALRHTFATRCIEQGFDIKSLSEILGHADVSITMQRYAHPSINLKRYYMEKLEVVAFHGTNSSQTKEKPLN